MKVRDLMWHGKRTQYKITDTGVIYGKNGKRMARRFCPNGYAQACIRVDGEYKYPYVHRAVYESFVGPIEPGYEINHIDGDKTNNDLRNLEVVTRLGNIKHSWYAGLAYKHNPHKGCHEKANRLYKLYPEEQIHDVCKALESPYLTYNEISDLYSIPIEIVWGIVKGSYWKDISKLYDISGRREKRAKNYLERDERIIRMRKNGYTAKEIANALDMTEIAVYRRFALMRKNGKMC